jgi:hypothetical protein
MSFLRALSHPLAGFLLPALFAVAAHGQGGPPFRTNDPETPGNRNWEINTGWVADRNPATGAYQVPDFEISYGLGDRIQLKYELPIAIQEIRPLPGQPGHLIAGVGESLLAVKWRFYEHRSEDTWLKDSFGTGLKEVFGRHPAEPVPAVADSKDSGDSPEAKETAESGASFSVSTYPQIFLDNPTNAVQRGLVARGPRLFLPIDFSARVGPIRINGEVGYDFGNHEVPQTWNRGLVAGHEFSDRTEAYVELYDIQDANRIQPGQGVGVFATGYPKQRETTLGLGGRQALNRDKTVKLLLMAGRSFQTVMAGNGQPSWIAYVGIQLLVEHR